VKVIFIEDVPDVAMAGEAKEVADGYGRNYLLPKKLAVLANSAASNVVEAQLKKVTVKRAQAEAEMAELAGKLEGVEVTLKAKTGTKDRLYGSITSADIAEELSKGAGQVIDKRKIELEEPIRQVGNYEVTVRLTQNIAPVIKVAVIAEQVIEEKPEKEEKKGKAKAAKKGKEKAEAKVEEAEEKTDEVVEAEAKAEEVEEVVEEAEEKVDEVLEPEARIEDVEKEDKVTEEKERAEETEKKVEETESGE
jgi:large subunit ribosomal protein L9